jgi:hypothetical protein
MTVTYETITSPIPNATVEKVYYDGVHRVHRITPNENYVMHDTARDFSRFEYEIDEETGETIETEIHMLGYGGQSTCAASYAFTPIEMEDENGNTVTAYGDRKFYCKLASDVPPDQIFGVVDNPEVL